MSLKQSSTSWKSVKNKSLSSVAIKVSVLVLLSLICTVPVWEPIVIPHGAPNLTCAGGLLVLHSLQEGALKAPSTFLWFSANISQGCHRSKCKNSSSTLGIQYSSWSYFPSIDLWESSLQSAIGRQDKMRFKNRLMKNKVAILTDFLFKQNVKGFPAWKIRTHIINCRADCILSCIK